MPGAGGQLAELLLDDRRQHEVIPAHATGRSAVPAARGPRHSGHARRADTSVDRHRPTGAPSRLARRARRPVDLLGLEPERDRRLGGVEALGGVALEGPRHSVVAERHVRDRRLDDERRLARPGRVPVARAHQEHRTGQLGERPHGRGAALRRGSRPAPRPGRLRAASPRATPRRAIAVDVVAGGEPRRGRAASAGRLSRASAVSPASGRTRPDAPAGTRGAARGEPARDGGRLVELDRDGRRRAAAR